jgi:protein-tyrosine phosphatase
MGEPSAPKGAAPILVLCTGNICRSPMAEAMFLRVLAERGSRTPVFSRGLAAPLGVEPHPHTQEVCRAKGLELAPDKRSAPVQPSDIAVAGVIFVMETAQRHAVQGRFPTASGKTWLLGHWEGVEIPDPLGSDLPAYESTYALIERGVASWAERLAQAGLIT